jgi:cytidine deaminase
MVARMAPLGTDDEALIERAADLVATHGDGELHSVAAAARAGDGRVVAGLNVFHFTGGPCAELVALGMAASEGMRQLATIVAVGDADRGIMPPCGRCRQVLLDHQPDIHVILPGESGPERVPIGRLLPHAWVWTPEGGSEPPGIR